MKIKILIGAAIPTLALAIGGMVLASHKDNNFLAAEAADYSTSNRNITINEDKSIDASFYLDNTIGNLLDIRGWLLCLFETKPSYDPITRKLDNSANLHPYSTADVNYYYYAASDADQGNISITWAANANDQKTSWSDEGSTVTEGKTLADVLNLKDWYIVVGPRHYNDNWAGTGIGAGTDNYWENCDYYVGQRSNIKNNYPSGEIYIDLTENTGWVGTGEHLSVYFWNSTVNAFSPFAIEDPTYDNIYVASYELNFQPTGMLLVGLKSSAVTPSWDDVKKQTGNFSFHEHAVIGVDSQEYGWENKLATVKITDKNDVVLDHYKRNLSNKSEHYNDGVDLKVNDTFYIDFLGTGYSSYSVLSTISDAFEAAEGNKIKVKVAGSYSFYFDTTEGSRKVYITKPSIAAADKWAQSFMHGDCTYSKGSWGTLRISYEELSYETRQLLSTAEHNDHSVDLSSGSYVDQAVQRYDYVLSLYPGNYYNFMGRTIYNLSGANVNSLNVANTNSTAVVMIVVIGISLTTILAGAVLLLKRKKCE